MTFRRALLYIVLVLPPLVVFAQVVTFRFVLWDDPAYIGANLINPVTPANFVRIWTSPFFSLYHPLTLSFFAVEALISRLLTGGGPLAPLDPRVFHVGCLMLHLANVVLVFQILRHLVRADWPACGGALVFAVHPLVVESVAWVSETKGLLSALFALLAIWLVVRDRLPEGIQLGAARFGSLDATVPTERYRNWATVCFVLALLAKPSAVVVPLIAVVFELTLGRRTLKVALFSVWDWLSMAVVWIFVTRYAQPTTVLGFDTPLWARPLIAGDSLVFYLQTLVWPAGLNADYGRTPQVVLASPWVYVRWLVPIGLLVVAAVVPGRRVWLAGLGIFVAALSPVLGLLAFQFQDYSTVADRYAYLALLGPSLILAWLLKKVDVRLAVPAMAVLIALLALASWRQAGVWRDEMALLDHMIELNPSSFSATNTLGLLATQNEEYAEAEELLSRAAEMRPHRAEPRVNLGDVYQKTNRWSDAEAAYRAALERDPKSHAAERGLGEIAAHDGDEAAAIEHFRKALELDPEDFLAADRLAWILATHPDAEVRDGVEAVELAQPGVRLLEAANPEMVATLAAAYAEVGEFAAAVQTAQVALDAAERQDNPELAAKIRAQLEHYESDEPFREPLGVKESSSSR